MFFTCQGAFQRFLEKGKKVANFCSHFSAPKKKPLLYSVYGGVVTDFFN